MQMSSLSSRGARARARRRWRDTAFYPLKVSDTLHVLHATHSYLSSALNWAHYSMKMNPKCLIWIYNFTIEVDLSGNTV